MKENFLAFLNLIGAAQGLFLAAHFFFKKTSNSWLSNIIALLIFALSLNLFNTFYIFIQGEWYTEFVQEVSNNMLWFIGPTIYLYVIYEPNQSRKVLLRRHLLPYLVLTVLGLLLYNTQLPRIYMVFGLLQVAIYLIVSIRILLVRFNTQSEFYKWVLPIVLSFTLLYFLNMLFIILNGLEIMYIPKIVSLNINLLNTIPIFVLAYREMNSKNDFGWKEQRYKSSQLDNAKSEDYLERIMHQLDVEHVYRDLNLTLARMSDLTDIPSKYISQTINDRLSKSFPDLINEYRINDIKQKLIDPGNSHLTILGMAQDAGFKSGGRFNTLFKSATGLTPTEYRKRHSEQ